jgi:ABC-2 type transport system ATP-binding protein
MLRISNLCKNYGRRPVLQDLSLEIAAGEIYGLIGSNGAGKTTTINILCNLLRPDSGQVKIAGLESSELTKKLIGIVPQENLLYRDLTCAENLNFFGQIYGLSKRERRSRVRECLIAVNLLDRANSPAAQLSGGMQRRLNIAIALIHHPKLVILDEPTTGLDVEARYEIWELIRQLQQQQITVLLTTHILEEAERLCQRIGLLKEGRIIAEGSIDELSMTMPGKEVVLVRTAQEEEAIHLALQRGFCHRRYANDLAFWLPEHLELKEIMAIFADIELDSIARQPIRLEHIYLELTAQHHSKIFTS